MAIAGPTLLAWPDGDSSDVPAQRCRDWLSRQPHQVLQVVDSHTAGNPTRIIVGGLEVPESVQTLDETRDWLRTRADWARRRLTHEPRGGALTCAVLPLPAVDDSHDLRTVFLEPGSYPPMCGHCTIGLAAVTHELGLASGSPGATGGTSYRILTPAGLTVATVHDGLPTVVELENVDSYVVDSWPVTIGGRELTCTLLYGGDYYPTLDAGELGLSLDPAHAGEIVRLARELSAQVRELHVVDPITGAKADIYQVMFHAGSDHSPHAATTAVVAPPGVIDRSPCGTGSSALMALKIARAEIGPDEELITRSIIGSEFRVRATGVRVVEGRQLITPVVSGSAHITGFATVAGDPSDSLADGFPPL